MCGVSGFRRKPSIPLPLVLTTIWIAAVSGEIALLLQQMGGSKSRGIHQLIETYRRPSEHGCLEKMILFFGGTSPNLSERFYFLRYVGLAVCGKTQNQSPQRPSSMDNTDLISDLKPRAYKPPAETRRVFACASSGRSERMPSQFFSN